jgi:hypothetical protein
MKIKHASHRTLYNCLREIMSELDHLYKGVCGKTKCYHVVVANFINNNKFLDKFASVSVSKVSGKLRRVKRIILENTSSTRMLRDQCLRAMESL